MKTERQTLTQDARIDLKQPQISILVPVYNVEPYLEQCLDSLSCQSFSNIEIICVDDGSTDQSWTGMRLWIQGYGSSIRKTPAMATA